MSNIQPLTSLTFGFIPPVEERQIPVVTPANRIPPFQIFRNQNAHGLADITVDAVFQHGYVVHLVPFLDAADPMDIVTLSSGIDIIIWKQSEPLTTDIQGGKFYIKVSDTVNTWYSKYWMLIQCGDIVMYPTEGGLVFDEYEITT
jgi:hypothetical protein